MYQPFEIYWPWAGILVGQIQNKNKKLKHHSSCKSCFSTGIQNKQESKFLCHKQEQLLDKLKNKHKREPEKKYTEGKKDFPRNYISKESQIKFKNLNYHAINIINY